MDNSYQSSEFSEIPRFLSRRHSEDFSDSCFGFNSSDESFESNTSSVKTNDSRSKCDLSLHTRLGGHHQTDINDSDTQSQSDRRKSFTAIVKFLKRIAKSKTSSDRPSASRSILRRPTEYVFVKGMSGLPMRVDKASAASSSTTSSCQRCLAKN
jgi:hypothetical protein